MTPIRVLCLLDNLAAGGAQEYVYQLCKSVDSNKVKLSVASARPGGVYEERLRALGVDVTAPAEHKSFSSVLKLIFWLGRILRAGNYDILHTFLPGGFLIGILASRLVDVSTVHTVLAPDVQSPLWYFRFMRLFQSLIHVYVVGDEKDMLRHRILPSKIRMAEMPINLENMYSVSHDENVSIGNSDLNDAYPLVVCAGRLHPHKGHRYIIEAWPEVVAAHPSARLLIVGTGIEEARLRDLARTLGVHRSIIFIDYLSDMAPLFSRADLFVRTSINEGVNMITTMAMASQLPVIGFVNPAPKDFIVHDRTGWLVPLKDIRKLSRAVLELSADSNARRRLGQHARRAVKKYFDYEQAIAFHEKLYLTVGNKLPLQSLDDMRTRMWPSHNPFEEY